MGLHHRAYFFIPIGLINAIYLCCDLELHSCFDRNFDRVIRPFFRCYPTEKREIAARGLRLKWQKIARQPVMNGTSPIACAQVLALIARDSNERKFLEDCV